MTDKPHFPILNPRYKGASPEEVAKALMRNWDKRGSLPEKRESEPEHDDEPEVA